MKLFSQIVGGIGDILLHMMKPGSHLGYFPALKARGDSTMLAVRANTDAAIQLFERLPYVDHIRFRAKTLRIDGPEGYEILRTWDGLPWQQPQLALDDEEQSILAAITREPYIAVHAAASDVNKAPAETDKLFSGLAASGLRTVLLGVETSDDGPSIGGYRLKGIRSTLAGTPHILLPPKLRLHIAVAQRATKFIGTLSCFNCAAQLAHVPSFVLVNRALQEPNIYKMMSKNGAIIQAWNIAGGPSRDAIYKRAVEWAKQ